MNRKRCITATASISLSWQGLQKPWWLLFHFQSQLLTAKQWQGEGAAATPTTTTTAATTKAVNSILGPVRGAASVAVWLNIHKCLLIATSAQCDAGTERKECIYYVYFFVFTFTKMHKSTCDGPVSDVPSHFRWQGMRVHSVQFEVHISLATFKMWLTFAICAWVEVKIV